MPLTELPTNLQKHGGATSEASLATDVPVQPQASSLYPAPAVQSMLKTSTELGDLGQIHLRAQRLPQSASYNQTRRPRTAPFESSFAPSARYRGTPSLALPPRHYRTPRHAPSLPAFRSPVPIPHKGPSQHHISRRMNGHRFVAQGSPPLLDEGSVPYGVHRPQPLRAMRSQREVRGMPSSSVATQLEGSRRPRYRTSSPNFSAARSNMTLGEAISRRNGHVHSGTPSPASMFIRQNGRQRRYHDLDDSIMSSVRLPSPALHAGRYLSRPSRFSSRTTTPMSLSTTDPHVQSEMRNPSVLGFAKPPSRSSTPYYYDYSEPFLDEKYVPAGTKEPACLLPSSSNHVVSDSGPASAFHCAQTLLSSEGESRVPLKGILMEPTSLPVEQSTQNTDTIVGASTLARPGLTKEEDDNQKSEENARSTPDDRFPRRSSAASPRTCTSTHSSSFFPNASRSPRDLTSLAAKVHSPGSNEPGQEQSESVFKGWQPCSPPLQPVSEVKDRLQDHGCQPPFCRTFPPHLIASSLRSSIVRPRTSGEIQSRSPIEIVSPMPERPASSQSRKRFSKILDLEEQDVFDSGKGISVHSSNLASSKRLEHISETSQVSHTMASPSELSMRNIQPSTVDQLSDILDAYADTSSGRDRFANYCTTDSVLDNHIESLGLENVEHGHMMPSSERIANSLITQKPGSFPGRRKDTLQGPAKVEARPVTSPSWKMSSTKAANPLSTQSRRPITSPHARRPNLCETQTLPLIFDTMSFPIANEFSPDSKQRWQSNSPHLPKTKPRESSLLSGELADISGEDPVQHCTPKTVLVPSGSVASLRRWSPVNSNNQDWDYASEAARRLCAAAAKQASRRRKMRVRLKIRRNSTNLENIPQLMRGKISPVSARRHSPTSHEFSFISNDVVGPCNTSAVNVRAGSIPEHVAQNVNRSEADVIGKAAVASTPCPDVVDRHSVRLEPSIIAIRQASTSSRRPPYNNADLVKPDSGHFPPPLIPRLGSLPKLEAPDFGPHLGPTDLSLNLPYADASGTVPSTLQGTRSFFSEDGSRGQREWPSCRKKFTLRSLRDLIPPSPRAFSSHRRRFSGALLHGQLDHDCQGTGKRFQENDVGHPEPVPMSDFAYGKRKVIEKLRGWWKKGCVQRCWTTIKIKREKGTDGPVLV